MIPQPHYEFKMVLVGDSAVGKSSILARFVDDQFKESLLSTIGVDFKFRKLKINDKQVKLQIWDTAGQETFRAIVSAYYNSADAIVIVYDISSQSTFDSVRDYWLGQAENHNKNDALVFIVGNKLDEMQGKDRKIENFRIEGVMDAHKINKGFEVSAKSGANIESMFIDIAKMLIAKNASMTANQEAPNAESKKTQNIKINNSESKSSNCCLK